MLKFNFNNWAIANLIGYSFFLSFMQIRCLSAAVSGPSYEKIKIRHLQIPA